MSQVVLDASAAVEVVLDTDLGLRLAGQLRPDDEIIVPDHFYSEVGAALRRMERHGDISPERAGLALQRVVSLRTQRVSVRSLVSAAWRLRANLTIGDALYVVLARRLRAKLVTADGRLARTPNLGIEVSFEA